MNIKELAERIVRNDGIVAFSPAERDLSKAVLLLLEDGGRLAKAAENYANNVMSVPRLTHADASELKTALAQHKQTVGGL